MIKKVYSWDIPTWLQGLFAAFVSGASGGLSAGGAATWIDHKDFAFGGVKSLKLMAATALLTGLQGVWMFLKQSPLPQRIEQTIEVDTGTGLEADARAVIKSTGQEVHTQAKVPEGGTIDVTSKKAE